MSEKVKYSIIIPTRNGGKYIESTINSILDCKFHDYEIVVSVNFSQDNTLEILEKYNNKIKVVTPPRPLCMAKHYEWCLTKVVGDWVTILGDDDAVMPFFFQELERLTKISNKEKINAISFKRAYYFWVEDGVTFDGKHVLFDGKKKDKIISTRKLIIQILSGGKSHYHLPQLYTNNLIRKKLLDEIKIKYKDFEPRMETC